jgi:hypothetical protein
MASHPLESAAFARRTPYPDSRDAEKRGALFDHSHAPEQGEERPISINRNDLTRSRFQWSTQATRSDCGRGAGKRCNGHRHCIAGAMIFSEGRYSFFGDHALMPAAAPCTVMQHAMHNHPTVSEFILTCGAISGRGSDRWPIDSGSRVARRPIMRVSRIRDAGADPTKYENASHRGRRPRHPRAPEAGAA